MKKQGSIPQEGAFHNHVLLGVGLRSLVMRTNQENISKRSADSMLSPVLSFASSLAAVFGIPEDANKDTLTHSQQFFVQIRGCSQQAVRKDL